MNGRDEARTQRRRRDDLRSGLDRVKVDGPDPAPSMVVKTVTVTSYPTVAQRVYGVVAVTPGGNESEGATPTLTAGTAVFFATNLGTVVPALGTHHVATTVDGRVVFAHYGPP